MTMPAGEIAKMNHASQLGLINSLLDSIPDIVFFKDTEGIYLGCNQPFAFFVGKSKDEIIGKTDYDLFNADVAGFFRHFDIEMLKQQQPRHNEEWITFPDGKKMLVDTLKTPYWGEDGALIGILGISRDITARKEAEDKVTESEKRFEQIAEHSRVITWEVNVEGLYTYVSNTIKTVLCYKPEEITGKKHFYDLHPEDGRESFKIAAFEVFARKETFRNLENRVVTKSGKVIYVTTNGIPILDESGKLAGYRGTDSDINDRKLTEIALKQSETRFKSLFDRHNAIMMLIDPVSGTIIDANDAAARFYGYSIDTLCSMNIDEITVSDTKHIEIERLEALHQKQNYFISPHKLSNGEVHIVEVHSSPVDFKEKQILFSIIHDITERKIAEEEIKQKSIELAKLNAEKDKFFSIIAHDMRGPFNGFLELTRIMADDMPDLTKEEILKLAGIMRNSATNLFHLLENLLEWSRLQRGVIPFQPTLFSLIANIVESMPPVVDMALKKGIEIRYEIPEGIKVFADNYMLTSIITNLASNAVKFTRNGGSITFKAKEEADNSVEISVTDTGIGMSPQMLNELFRLDTHTSRRGTNGEPSSGLGLILCKDFIEKHKGKLFVHSEKEVGSTFRFTLPNIEI